MEDSRFLFRDVTIWSGGVRIWAGSLGDFLISNDEFSIKDVRDMAQELDESGEVRLGGGAGPLFVMLPDKYQTLIETPEGMRYRLPPGWTWRMVVAARVKWDIDDRFYPVARAGGCVAWGIPLDGKGGCALRDV